MPNIKINDPYVNFILKNTEGIDCSLDMEDIKPIKVIIFSCNHCPYAQAWEQRIINIQNKYKDKGVTVIMISSNDAESYPEDNFEKMKERHIGKKFNFNYLYDESQEVAKIYGAERTPEVFVFDGLGLLKYTGAIDDNYENEVDVTQEYLADAIDMIIDGKEPSTSSTPAVGCTIKWKS